MSETVRTIVRTINPRPTQVQFDPSYEDKIPTENTKN